MQFKNEQYDITLLDQDFVHSRVAMSARHKPDAIAVSDRNANLTYRAMCFSADRLAVRLALAGVREETLVGVCLPRSFARIIAMLAIWQAGGAVLPLDPAWPPERLRPLLDESGALFALATDAFAPNLSGENRISLVIDDDVWSGDGAQALRAVLPPQPGSLAYVVYTSGSTGAPKGVEITHQNLAHLIKWHQAAFALSETDRVSHVAGLGFDASILEVWPALCAGASVILVEEPARTSPDLLKRWSLEEGITVAFVPTVLAEILVVADWPADSALRLLLTGGEALHRRPRPDLPFSVVNNYGPSECTVVATSGTIDPDSAGLPDIGWAIDGTSIHILNDAGDPVIDGETGEIVIGGPGVGRGYRNRPDLTQERFLPDIFNPTGNGRLYRTGDFGRRLPDGRIAFLGRADAQEQIRGSRVEPAEVAAVLTRHPMVRWCAVIGDGPAQSRRLVAYVLPEAGTELLSEALREFLEMLLPEAMIPSDFVAIEKVPLSDNGKFDLAALPPLVTATPLKRSAFRAPTTPAEARLASIISEALGGSPVGANDNFFLLGGHSLLGMQVVLRAQDAFGVQLSLRDLFQAPTVAGLAERIADLLARTLDAMTDEEAELWAAN